MSDRPTTLPLVHLGQNLDARYEGTCPTCQTVIKVEWCPHANAPDVAPLIPPPTIGATHQCAAHVTDLVVVYRGSADHCKSIFISDSERELRELQEAKLSADRLSARITKWIGAYGAELICPRAKHTPSPCAAIDGAVAVALSTGTHPCGVCVECGESVAQIVRDETTA